MGPGNFLGSAWRGGSQLSLSETYTSKLATGFIFRMIGRLEAEPMPRSFSCHVVGDPPQTALISMFGTFIRTTRSNVTC